jgi:hypothetical protein
MIFALQFDRQIVELVHAFYNLNFDFRIKTTFKGRSLGKNCVAQERALQLSERALKNDSMFMQKNSMEFLFLLLFRFDQNPNLLLTTAESLQQFIQLNLEMCTNRPMAKIVKYFFEIVIYNEGFKFTSLFGAQFSQVDSWHYP